MTERFHLAVGEVIQGDMALESRTLLLVFQVNCPSCFAYALPLAEALHQDSKRLGLSVKALSTAFEDFEFNTAEHTRAFVEKGTLIGETRKSLGVDTYGGIITFPVAVDAGMEKGVGETFSANCLRGPPEAATLVNCRSARTLSELGLLGSRKGWSADSTIDLDINDVAVDGASALAGIVLPHAAHEAEGKQ
jgi:hypothetical protein